MTGETAPMRTGYITDVAYTTHYYKELNPHLLGYVAALNGYPPRALDGGFDYCELGCGSGLTTNVLAAANPRGRFVAVDFNPEHVGEARALAEAGALENVTFLEQDFAALGDSALPDFDFIALHGVYTWVSPEVRAQIRAFIDSKLRPGGIVYLSYNVLPGWAGIAPLREMMSAYAGGMAVDSLEKARLGLKYLRFLCDREAPYFAAYPGAKRHLEELEKRELRYVAHEYLNQHWEPLYFAEVARALREIGLEFAGSLPVSLNYRDLCLPENVQDIFATAPDRYTFEIHKDFVRNDRFRRDVWVRPTAPSRTLGPEDFKGIRFGTMVAREQIAMEAAVPAGQVRLEGTLFPVLIELLTAEGPQALDTLLENPALAGYSSDEVLRALQRLVVTGQFQPAARPGPPETAPDGDLKAASALNRALLERGIAERGAAVQASEVFGGGFNLAFPEALMLLAIDQVGFGGAVEWAEQELERQGARLTDAEGRVIDDPKVLQGALGATRDAFRGPPGAHFWRCALMVAA